ncbi:MAG TPA: 23S rRNA (adenine(2503)-C(2))-methyltransferase RlmN [Roseiarcus sp.]|nr:23S rRNA (adenine(2503)-C(2))-methyltransferase RlmN [Roseiarcus sp.]
MNASPTVAERPAGATSAKPSLAGATRAELAEALRGLGLAEREIHMRVAQLWHWIYFRGAGDFDKMLNIARPMRALLAERFSLARPVIVAEQVSTDGTRKWLLRMARTSRHDKGAEIECVYIPEADRGTLCVSSQVGCTLTCSFCHTGTQKLVRNLTAAEIVGQVLVARDRLGDFPGGVAPTDGLVPSGEGVRAVSNIVFMGMGEPLYNFDHVREAIGVLCDGEGLSLSKRRITVSTSGVAPQMAPLGEQCGTMLAVSLHATNDALRDTLVPLNKKYPIKVLLDACRTYPGASNARRITFEYVMLKGVNDTPAEARALVRLLKGLPAKINLIPFNPWPGSAYECSDWDTIERFSDIVFNAGYASPVRTPRGRDILAACGQLKSETERLRARARLMLEESLALGQE